MRGIKKENKNKNGKNYRKKLEDYLTQFPESKGPLFHTRTIGHLLRTWRRLSWENMGFSSEIDVANRRSYSCNLRRALTVSIQIIEKTLRSPSTGDRWARRRLAWHPLTISVVERDVFLRAPFDSTPYFGNDRHQRSLGVLLYAFEKEGKKVWEQKKRRRKFWLLFNFKVRQNGGVRRSKGLKKSWNKI